jgi:hypothetical protein
LINDNRSLPGMDGLSVIDLGVQVSVSVAAAKLIGQDAT